MRVTDQRVSDVLDGERAPLFAIAYGMLGSSIEASGTRSETCVIPRGRSVLRCRVMASRHAAGGPKPATPAAFLAGVVIAETCPTELLRRSR
jgi:hypothetical protein